MTEAQKKSWKEIIELLESDPTGTIEVNIKVFREIVSWERLRLKEATKKQLINYWIKHKDWNTYDMLEVLEKVFK